MRRRAFLRRAAALAADASAAAGGLRDSLYSISLATAP